MSGTAKNNIASALLLHCLKYSGKYVNLLRWSSVVFMFLSYIMFIYYFVFMPGFTSMWVPQQSSYCVLPYFVSLLRLRKK